MRKRRESHFRETAPRSRILHLATHTLIDDEEPLRSGLVFQADPDRPDDGFLSAREIYDLQLPADLAVMSACDTGFGQLSEGEGVMSLGRAFRYAGCRSIVMSLWLSNDQATANLMDSLLPALGLGESQGRSLATS